MQQVRAGLTKVQFTSAALAVASLALTAPAYATTFGFAADPNHFITTYQGFDFGPFTTSWVNGTVAPANATPAAALGYAWSNGGQALTMTLAAPGSFTLNSVDLFQNAAAQSQPAQSVTITGLLSGVPVDTYTTPPLSSTTAFTTFTLNWTGIDELTFSATLDNLALTNFVVNEAVPSIPEPFRAALLGTSLLGLGALKRRCRV